MKEVFTKSFWQGVKNTFHEALEDSPPTENALKTPAEGDPNASSTPATHPLPRPHRRHRFRAEPAELLSDISNFHRNQRRNHGGTERNSRPAWVRDRFRTGSGAVPEFR